MINLDDIKDVKLTVRECVLLRDAIRAYVQNMMEYVKEDLDDAKATAAQTHSTMITDAIRVFGKL